MFECSPLVRFTCKRSKVNEPATLAAGIVLNPLVSKPTIGLEIERENKPTSDFTNSGICLYKIGNEP